MVEKGSKWEDDINHHILVGSQVKWEDDINHHILVCSQVKWEDDINHHILVCSQVKWEDDINHHILVCSQVPTLCFLYGLGRHLVFWINCEISFVQPNFKIRILFRFQFISYNQVDYCLKSKSPAAFKLIYILLSNPFLYFLNVSGWLWK